MDASVPCLSGGNHVIAAVACNPKAGAFLSERGVHLQTPVDWVVLRPPFDLAIALIFKLTTFQYVGAASLSLVGYLLSLHS